MRLSIIAASALLTATLGMVACSSADRPSYESLRGTGVGIDVESMDKAIAPGDDFYAYANGNWLNNTQIPEDAALIGRRSAARDLLQTRLLAIIQEIAGTPQPKGSNEARIRDFYRGYMNETAIEQAGTAPIAPDRDRIDGIADFAALSREIGSQMRANGDPFGRGVGQGMDGAEALFAMPVLPSRRDATMVPYVMPGGLGLPSDLYDGSDPRGPRIVGAYRDHVARVLRWAGRDGASDRARAVVALEGRIAAAHRAPPTGGNAAGFPDEWLQEDFARYAPGMDWDAFLAGAGLDRQGRFAVPSARAVTLLSALVASEPLGVWQDWLLFHQINAHADFLPRDIAGSHFRLYDQRLSGIERQPPREEQAIRAIARLYGPVLMPIYADRHVPAEQLEDVEAIAENVREAFARRISDNDWLSAEAREAALDKVREMRIGIGRPADTAPFAIPEARGRTPYALALAAKRGAWNARRKLAGTAVDRNEWLIAAHEFEALNLPMHNAINIPAVWLQSPYYNADAEAAANYGAIGALIGRQMAEGIDRSGASYDSEGRPREWWSADDRAAFDERAAALAEQYSAYRPFADQTLDGGRTSDANIADLVGLSMAYEAYRASLGRKEPPVIEGLTGDQRFFIAYAQSLAFKLREGQARLVAQSGEEALPRYRAMTVRNIDAWYRAFDVQPGAAMYLEPEARVSVW